MILDFTTVSSPDNGGDVLPHPGLYGRYRIPDPTESQYGNVPPSNVHNANEPRSDDIQAQSQRSKATRKTNPGRLQLSSDVVGFFIADVSQLISQGWISPLLISIEPLLEDGGAVQEFLEVSVENILVAVGEDQAAGELEHFPIALAEPSGFSPPMTFEFLRRFPLSPVALSSFMRLVLRDLKSSYAEGYCVHGDWGRLAWDKVTDRIEFVRRR